MSRQWTPESRKAHSDYMRRLYTIERMRKESGLEQKTRLRVSGQRKMIFIIYENN